MPEHRRRSRSRKRASYRSAGEAPGLSRWQRQVFWYLAVLLAGAMAGWYLLHAERSSTVISEPIPATAGLPR
jgi:hypothetical protein